MDISKHYDYFNPAKHPGKIAVIGAGATGSATTLTLAKLGLKNIMIYDFDRIEEHNIPNQILYSPNHIEQLKAPILANLVNDLVDFNCCDFSCVKINIHKQLNREQTVFICVDTMEARKEIFENCIFINGSTNLVIDMRINATSGMIYIFNPCDIIHCKYYRDTLYSDDDVDSQKGNCGITLSIGSTAGLIANWAIAVFIDWIMERNRNYFSYKFNINPPLLVSTQFKQLEDC